MIVQLSHFREKNMKAEEERKRKFMEARGGSVSDIHIKVNGEWVVDRKP